MKLEWIPLKRIGDFEFGKPIQAYIESHHLVQVPEEQRDGWTEYALTDYDEFRIYVEGDIVVAISCSEECWYKGKNLIGMNIEAVVELIGVQPNEDVDTIYLWDKPQEVYEFNDVEADIWVQDGKVDSISCWARYD